MKKVRRGVTWVLEAGGGRLRDAVTLTAAVVPLIRLSEPDKPREVGWPTPSGPDGSKLE